MKIYLQTFLFVIVSLSLSSCNYSANTNDVSSSPQSYSVYQSAELHSEVVNDILHKSTDQQKIIKTGTLSFETSDLEKTTNKVYQLVKKYNADIQNDIEGKNYSSYYKNITIRIDNQKFESLFEDIGRGVNYFDTKEISSQDVTAQYIDVQARIKTRKELENRYLELLKKATKISEMIDIETNLSKIREEIEVTERQLNYLQNQVALSTIVVNFYQKTSDTGITNSYGHKILNALKHGFNSMSSLVIFLLKNWGIIILLWLVYWYYKRYKKKKKEKKNEISS